MWRRTESYVQAGVWQTMDFLNKHKHTRRVRCARVDFEWHIRLHQFIYVMLRLNRFENSVKTKAQRIHFAQLLNVLVACRDHFSMNMKQSELSALNGKCSVYFGWMQKLEIEPALLRSCIMIRCRCAPTNVAIWLVTSIYNGGKKTSLQTQSPKNNGHIDTFKLLTMYRQNRENGSNQIQQWSWLCIKSMWFDYGLWFEFCISFHYITLRLRFSYRISVSNRSFFHNFELHQILPSTYLSICLFIYVFVERISYKGSKHVMKRSLSTFASIYGFDILECITLPIIISVCLSKIFYSELGRFTFQKEKKLGSHEAYWIRFYSVARKILNFQLTRKFSQLNEVNNVPERRALNNRPIGDWVRWCWLLKSVY